MEMCHIYTPIQYGEYNHYVLKYMPVKVKKTNENKKPKQSLDVYSQDSLRQV